MMYWEELLEDEELEEEEEQGEEDYDDYLFNHCHDYYDYD